MKPGMEISSCLMLDHRMLQIFRSGHTTYIAANENIGPTLEPAMHYTMHTLGPVMVYVDTL